MADFIHVWMSGIMNTFETLKAFKEKINSYDKDDFETFLKDNHTTWEDDAMTWDDIIADGKWEEVKKTVNSLTSVEDKKDSEDDWYQEVTEECPYEGCLDAIRLTFTNEVRKIYGKKVVSQEGGRKKKRSRKSRRGKKRSRKSRRGKKRSRKSRRGKKKSRRRRRTKRRR